MASWRLAASAWSCARAWAYSSAPACRSKRVTSAHCSRVAVRWSAMRATSGRALGATRQQLRCLVTAETVVITGCGLAAGAVTGAALSQMLVKVLTGVFDPPPDVLTVPWAYLALVGACTIAALGVAAAGAARAAGRSSLTVLREL